MKEYQMTDHKGIIVRTGECVPTARCVTVEMRKHFDDEIFVQRKIVQGVKTNTFYVNKSYTLQFKVEEEQ